MGKKAERGNFCHDDLRLAEALLGKLRQKKKRGQQGTAGVPGHELVSRCSFLMESRHDRWGCTGAALGSLGLVWKLPFLPQLVVIPAMVQPCNVGRISCDAVVFADLPNAAPKSWESSGSRAAFFESEFHSTFARDFHDHIGRLTCRLVTRMSISAPVAT